MTERTAVAALVLALAGVGLAHAQVVGPGFTPRTPLVVRAQPPLPSPATVPLQLVLDDDQHEGAFGFAGGQGARQFLWFNRFAVPAGRFALTEVWVLFPSGANITVGAAVQIAIYSDADGNPANGATLLTTFNTTIQAANDVNFSIYSLPTAIELPPFGDILIGVVPRFITSGVTPPTNPAAVDTTATRGRSWIAVWSGDPPAIPMLPPDVLITTLDTVQPGGGNFMIRGFGQSLAPLSVPAVSMLGTLALLVATLVAAAAVFARRRRGAR